MSKIFDFGQDDVLSARLAAMLAVTAKDWGLQPPQDPKPAPVLDIEDVADEELACAQPA